MDTPSLPHSVEAERCVLGAILLDNEALPPILQVLEPADFFLSGHGRILAQMLKLSERSHPIDLVTLHEEIERAGELEAVGGSAYLSSLVDGVPMVSNVGFYAGIVKEKAALREIARTADAAVQRALKGREKPDIILNSTEAALKNIAAHYLNGSWAHRNLKFCTGAELAAETSSEPRWIARPWVPAGSITEVAGKVKLAGKTTWLLHMSRAVVEGTNFMGEPTTRTPVVYLTEQSPASFRPQLEKTDLLGRDDFVVLFWAETLGLDWETVVQVAVRECKRRGSGLLIIDTLGQFAGLEGDSENNAGDALLAMQPLQKAAAEGLSIVTARHERKAGGAVGDASRGSSAFAGAVDTLVAIRRPRGKHRDTIRSLQGVSRFDGVPEELMVELTQDGYEAVGQATDLAAREAEEAILGSAPQTQEEAARLDSLLEGTSVTRTTAQRVIKKLLASGLIVKTGMGRKNSPHRFWMPGCVRSVP